MESLSSGGHWYWLVAALLLVIAEALLPGAQLLWLGAAAAVVGAVLFVVPGLAWQGQVVIFAVVSIATIWFWRLYQSDHPAGSDDPNLNRRGFQYVGRQLTLASPIVNGLGKVQVDDTAWKVRGEDLPGGSRVTVVGVDGTVMLVERASERP